MYKNLTDIEHILRKHKPDLFNKYNIRSLAIFGSFARNEQENESDLDILVEFNNNIGMEFIDLADELEKLIGYKVDLVSKNGIKSRYLKAIQSDLIYV